MAEQTTNYGLTLPGENDFYNVEDFNGNMEKIDTGIKTAQDKADQAFQSASNGKSAIKAAITGVDPEVTIPTEATFVQLAAAIGQIKTGVDTEDATALAEQILNSMTAYVKGVKVTGTMANRGAVNITPGTANQAIPKGYHNGNGMVAGDPDLITGNIKAGVNIFGVNGKSSIVDTADATIPDSGYLYQGVTAYKNGSKITGTMLVSIPDNGDQIPAQDGYVSVGVYSQDGLNNAYMRLPNNHYLAGVNYVRHYEPDLLAQNILAGKSIMGVSGSVVVGRKIQSGATTSSAVYLTFKNGGGDASMFSLTVTGLTFKPSYIMAFNSTSSTQGYYVIYKADGIGLNAYNVKIFTGNTYYMSSNLYTYGYREDGTAAYVNSTSFRIPCLARDELMYWIAVE